MVRLIFDSLGWVLSADEDKNKPFSVAFQALGVEINLAGTPEGYFTVGNTQSRKDEINEKLQSILADDSLEPALAESLRSRLLFAEGQIFGRFAKQALNCVGAIGFRTSPEKPLGSDLRYALTWFSERLLLAPPRKIDRGGRPTYFLFLDGACTTDSCESSCWRGTSIGGVLAGSDGKVLRFFGHVVDPNLVSTWGPAEKSQYIFEAEVLPFAVALRLWHDVLRDCCVFVFIDNEAAKASWITASAHSEVAQRILHNGTLLEASLNVWP